MSPLSAVALLVLVAGLSVGLTAAMRRYALRRRLLDIPNDRSSHDVPTPRGGGVAIVCASLFGSAVLWWLDVVPAAQFAGLAGGGILVAGVGYLDDHRDIPARWRAVVHAAAAAVLLAAAGGLPSLSFFGVALTPGVAGVVVVLLLIVWIVNLYNFMDGIDGIAGIEAVTVCSGAALLLWLDGAGGAALLVAVYAAASLGFLAWNWPPAGIFMGDVGSGFLGFSLAGLAVLTWVGPGFPVWTWLILLGVFMVDATVTLLRRVLRGERWYQAHRSHAYQHASRRFGSHRPVTVAVALLNLGWLLPMAVASTRAPQWGPALLVVAWMPLLWLALRFNAGLPENARE